MKMHFFQRKSLFFNDLIGCSLIILIEHEKMCKPKCLIKIDVFCTFQAVKQSREKAKKKKADGEARRDALKLENPIYRERIKQKEGEVKMLKEMFDGIADSKSVSKADLQNIMADSDDQNGADES